MASGPAAINLGVAIPKGIDAASRTGDANWGIDLTLTYVDGNRAVQTIDSGPLLVKDGTIFLQPIDNNTDLTQATLQFGGAGSCGQYPELQRHGDAHQPRLLARIHAPTTESRAPPALAVPGQFPFRARRAPRR